MGGRGFGTTPQIRQKFFAKNIVRKGEEGGTPQIRQNEGILEKKL